MSALKGFILLTTENVSDKSVLFASAYIGVNVTLLYDIVKNMALDINANKSDDIKRYSNKYI